MEHGVTGWRYPRGNIASLIETVREVLTNSSERERITNAAREQMRTKITIENMVEQIDRCVTDALEIAHARRNPQ